MSGGGSESQQRLRRQRPIFIEYFALGHNKISARAQYACVRLDPSARYRLKIIDAQFHRSDLRPVGNRRISRDRCGRVRQRRQNPPVHHAMNLLVVWPYIQPENRSSRVHALHLESQKLRRAAFFDPPPHEFRHPLLFFRHFLGHRVFSPRQYAVSPPSNGIAAPVSHDDSSEARNTAISATSTGCPKRPKGIKAIRPFRSACPCSLASKSPFTNSVSTIEGQMQFTRMFSCP